MKQYNNRLGIFYIFPSSCCWLCYISLSDFKYLRRVNQSSLFSSSFILSRNYFIFSSCVVFCCLQPPFFIFFYFSVKQFRRKIWKTFLCFIGVFNLFFSLDFFHLRKDFFHASFSFCFYISKINMTHFLFLYATFLVLNNYRYSFLLQGFDHSM